MTKCEKLKNLINSKELSFLMECHSGLSAKIIEETGFKGGWISGLSLSAMAGVRDRNELSFKEVADLCYYICSRVEIPMLLDMDTGYGDFNTASTAIRMIESAGVAGVCIEDKKFPKHNSFLANSFDDLEDPYVFGSKIKALHESTYDPNFVVVARLEGFISGQGLEETYRRACIYEEYGADAILVHSKIKTADEIISFMEKWNSRHSTPVVIVPTKYYTTSTDVFEEIGISTVIWANHNLRSSLSAMQSVSREIYKNKSLVSVEPKIASVNEVFRIQRDEEVSKAEDEYNPPASGSAVVLSGLANSGIPKCLTLIGEDQRTILNRYYEGFKRINVSPGDVLVVFGEGANEYNIQEAIVSALNRKWKTTSENYSLKLGIDSFGNDIKLPLYIIYGDLSLKSSVFTKMNYLGRNADVAIAYTQTTDPNDYNEYVSGFPIKESSDEIKINSVCHHHDSSMILGSSIGLIKINTAKAVYRIMEILENEEISGSPCIRLDYVLDLLCKDFNIVGIKIRDDEWLDVNE